MMVFARGVEGGSDHVDVSTAIERQRIRFCCRLLTLWRAIIGVAG